MSIHKITKGVKVFLRHHHMIIAYVAIVFCMTISGYLLGNIVVFIPEKEPITIEYPPLLPGVARCDTSVVTSPKIGDQGTFVASQHGSKYYPVTCSGVNRIKEENKVYFASEKEAIEQGYEKASGC